MFAALLWKEWREQRGVIWAGLALSLILPMVIRSSIGVIGAGEDAIIFAQLVALGAMLFAWPLFAALTAASAHAEREPATAGSCCRARSASERS
jgi:hypothetical protein